MSDEFQWRPIGFVVNNVLKDAKLRAIRNASIRSAGVQPRAATVSPEPACTNGQYELPFGIAKKPAPTAPAFGAPAAPRGVRLM